MSRSSSPGTEPPAAALGTSFALRANNCPGGLPAALGCVIMASGMGKRFGGNKLMAQLGGKPLICWVLDATQGIFDRRVVVTRHAQVEALCRERQVPVVLHDLPCRSDTVRLGLEALGTSFALRANDCPGSLPAAPGDGLSGCLFCPGDQPLLSKETVQTMALQAARGPEFIWRLSWGGTAGTPVLFPRWAFPRLMALPQGKGGNVVVQENPEQVRFVPARDRCELWDVDRPEDLEKLSAWLER